MPLQWDGAESGDMKMLFVTSQSSEFKIGFVRSYISMNGTNFQMLKDIHAALSFFYFFFFTFLTMLCFVKAATQQLAIANSYCIAFACIIILIIIYNNYYNIIIITIVIMI